MSSDLDNRNAGVMLETLKDLRAENSALRLRLEILEKRLETTNNRFDALDTLLRNLQAAAVGTGPSVRED